MVKSGNAALELDRLGGGTIVSRSLLVSIPIPILTRLWLRRWRGALTVTGPLAFVIASGCRSGGAKADIAARMGEHTLTAARLSEILVLSQPLPLRPEVATELARHWVHVAALAASVAAGDSLLGWEVADAATALESQQRRVEAYLRSRALDTPAMTRRAADSVYGAGELRLIAHVFRRVGPETRPEEAELQRLAAERIRGRLLEGGSWREATRESEDEQSRETGGILGLMRRGATVPEFEQAAFVLQPGELSPVIRTRFGYHILHRPRLDDVRELFVQLLAEDVASRADSIHGEALLAARRVRLAPDAVEVLRRIANDPWRHVNGTHTVATYHGGMLAESQLARQLLFLPLEARDELSRVPAEEGRALLHSLIVQELIALEADSAGFVLADSIRRSIRGRYRQEIVALVRDVDAGRPNDEVSGPDALAHRIDLYMEAVAARRVELRPVPPLLAVYLLEGVSAEVVPAGVEMAVARAERLLAGASDSAIPSPSSGER